MGGPPAAPDPYATADAQARANSKSARESQQMSMVDQVTPYGTLTHDQIGAYEDGTPRFRATTQLAPEQRGLLDQQNRLSSGVNALALDQVGRLKGVLDQPVNLSNEATEERLWGLGRKRLDPMLADRQRSLESSLVSEGHARGTPAWEAAMKAHGEMGNDAYNQLLLSGRGQSVSEALAERNQPINEIVALMGGGQVTQPSFVNTPNASVAAPDVQGLVNENYKSQVAQHNAKMGGLFGLGGALLGGGMRLAGGMF